MTADTPDQTPMPADGRRALPAVDQLLSVPELADWGTALPHDLLVATARDTLAAARAELAAGAPLPDRAALARDLAARLQAATEPSLRPVINAGGVIIQTNLGRAPLSAAARAAMAAAAGYSNLEYDLDAGARGSRYVHAARLLTRLTGAEDALVVNNAAAALYFVLLVLAAGREVVLARGQAVEIGGGFRIPDILRQSGATLVEVGTTNRTYARDYETALSTATAGLLRVHTSNFRVIGFTHAVGVADLAAIAQRHGVWLADDVGSGTLLSTAAYGLAPEPLVQESVAAGADLVLFSGDKLLGGPQAGIIVGRKEPLAALRRHPLARALRVDKITYAGLEATLLHYVRGEAPATVPVWAMISADAAALQERAERWAAVLAAAGLPVGVRSGRSAVGGGTLPGETLPTWLLAIGAEAKATAAAPPLSAPSTSEDDEAAVPPGPSAAALARRLRRGTPAVVARVEHDLVLCDPRTVLPDQDNDLLAAIQAAWQG
ncbi:MAG TPA: L-seryl-tRNA(Sec) selenium transferase [Chloroflexia bacterium]|nr:L-seryl-tRNA(Sec) selenium transferase [Chloroflexia bacterium]